MQRPSKPLLAIVGAAAAGVLMAMVPANEGTVYRTYRDLGGVLTYCTGATENAQWGKTYTPGECAAQLDRDLARHAEGVMGCVHVQLTDGQKVAFVDFTYNAGISAFCGSSMARKANAGDMVGACNALMMWDKVKGQTVRGLTRRRTVERDFCLGRTPIFNKG
jgi:lysozyme